jgi:hypothetical protein
LSLNFGSSVPRPRSSFARTPEGGVAIATPATVAAAAACDGD